jgi:hypothetical protein
LHLPGNIIEDDRASAEYDVAEVKITAKIPKETSGQHFPDLDLLPKLLARRGETMGTTVNTTNARNIGEQSDCILSTKRRSNAPLIEVLSEDEIQDDNKSALLSSLEEGMLDLLTCI